MFKRVVRLSWCSLKFKIDFMHERNNPLLFLTQHIQKE